MLKEGAFVNVQPVSPHGNDKRTKATAFQGMASSGGVWIPEGPEGDAIINQYVKFPAALNDEEVDVGGIIGRVIFDAHPAIVPHEKPKTGADRWDKAFERDDADADSWKTT